MAEVDRSAGRHFVGPEQPQAPPRPNVFRDNKIVSGDAGIYASAMPPAEELVGAAPPLNPNQDAFAFEQWFRQRMDDDENPAGVMKLQRILEEAFHAGIAHVRESMAASVRTHRAVEAPLEGTVESRTIIAALQLFKEQVLVNNPEEVRAGEWLNARDVDTLIAGIRQRSAS